MRSFLACLLTSFALFATDACAAGWSFSRQAPDLNGSFENSGILRLDGAYDTQQTHASLRAQLARMFPFEKIVDDLVQGADGFGEKTADNALHVLSLLETGRVARSDHKIDVRGVVQSGGDVAAVKQLVERTSWGSGLSIGMVELKPSSVQVPTWVASKVGNKVKLDGTVPSREAKGAIAASAKSAFPDAKIVDNSIVASTKPDRAFEKTAKVGLDQLKNFDSGSIKFDGTQLSVSTVIKAGETVASASTMGDAFESVTKYALRPDNGKTVDFVFPNTFSDPRTVEFLFATDRKPMAGPSFGYERSDALSFGTAKVHIPSDHHKIGHIELPHDWKIFGFTIWKGTPDKDKHFIVEGVQTLSKADWTNLLRARDDEAFIFVHGFNTSFDDAVLRTAQIVWDLQYKGNAILFSWPSRGDALSYEYDRNSALFARAHFLQLLAMLDEDAHVRKIHVLCHSMGNFAVVDALSYLADLAHPPRIAQLIMAAPDVDRDQFRQDIAKIAPIVTGMTLYASAADRAMLLSRSLAQGPRAGDVLNGLPMLVSGVDSIDVTNVGDELLGLNHDEFASNRNLIDDIKLVLGGTRPPDVRLAQIRRMPEGAPMATFWRYVR